MQTDLTTSRARQAEVTGGGGLRLHVQDAGDPAAPPILFIHGWSQSALCWSRQLDVLAGDFRLVAPDIRGHGMSEKPLAAEAYADGRLWADDVAAVIEQLGLDKPVVVAWSYGGLALCDYVRVHGDGRIGAINLVGAAVMLRPPAFDHIGPGFLAHADGACSADLGTQSAAIRGFLRACTARELESDEWSEALCWNMVVPPEVRGALLARAVDSDDVLAGLSVPVLVTHGRSDEIVLPSMAEHVLAACPAATASWYDDVGHMPFVEDAGRFNRELAQLTVRSR